jgi:hypothetical protein
VTVTTDADGRPLRLLAAVAARHGADRRCDLVEAMRAVVEDAMGPACATQSGRRCLRARAAWPNTAR